MKLKWPQVAGDEWVHYGHRVKVGPDGTVYADESILRILVGLPGVQVVVEEISPPEPPKSKPTIDDLNSSYTRSELVGMLPEGVTVKARDHKVKIAKLVQEHWGK